MYQIDWANKDIWDKESKIPNGYKSRLDRSEVEHALLLLWSEHCMECSPPSCYGACPVYVPRSDKKCLKFSYGIYPNTGFKGLFDFGADIRFKKWGKLETKLYRKTVSVDRHLSLHRGNKVIAGAVNFFSDILQPLSPKRRLNGAFTYFREKFLEEILPGKFTQASGAPDEFVLEAFSAEKEPCRLILEYVEEEIKFRHAFDLSPGMNFYTIPAKKFRIDFSSPNGLIRIYPDRDAQVRVIFVWLDFVKYKKGHEAKGHGESKDIAAAAVSPASKVKCVIWDLDNTLWRGILAEDTANNLRIRPEAMELIKKLDEKGIIQSIASKNNFDDAWAVIEKLQLQDYFLYPAIHWGPKSGSLKEIAEKLNVNVDTFAFIDDSPFERAEVQSVLPQVRVYSDEQISELLGYPEFNVPVTEMSRMRRASYLADIQRNRIKDSFSGDYDRFLLSCGMKLSLFIPTEKKDIERCLELIQRSNQLNLSGRRYTSDEFDLLLLRAGTLNIALHCSDKFGDYGIVGFASVEATDKNFIVRDFVLSCRVAQKRVEHAFFTWLAARARSCGKASLQANLIRTERNKPLSLVFDDMSFSAIKSVGNNVLLELPADAVLDAKQVVSLDVLLPEVNLENSALYQHAAASPKAGTRTRC